MGLNNTFITFYNNTSLPSIAIIRSAMVKIRHSTVYFVAENPQ